ncbi:MAG: competence protein ComK [Mycoplasmatota bacterium]|nr:competence protein ComK [Mycoplasmatota bacterium]
MYEIDLSTLMLIGIDDSRTLVVTLEKEFIVDECAKKIIDNSCKYFGSTLVERIKATQRVVNIRSKVPIIIENSRNIIFFPLKSCREKSNIWISFNNLVRYEKKDNVTYLYFKENKVQKLDFSYYIIDNQVTRSLLLDYEMNKRRKSLEK